MKKYIYVFSVALFFSNILYSQGIIFQKSYDFSYDDAAHDVIATTDNGFILVGETRNENDIRNMLIIKTDENGDLVWSKTYGADSSCHAKRIINSIGGNYLIAGSYGSQAYLLKINSEGDSIWSNIFYNEYGSSLRDVVELNNSDLLLIQTIFLIPYSSKIIYTDATGNTLWNISASANESKDIHLISDSEFYVAGFNGIANYPFNILTKYDILGNVVLNEEFSSFEGINVCSAISQDENIYMGGMKDNGYLFNASIMKSNFECELLWEKTYFDLAYSSITSIVSADSNYIIAAGVYNDELFILRINENGDSLKSIRFDEYNMQQGNAMILQEDNLLIAGLHFNWSEGKDVYFIKLNLDTLSVGIINPYEKMNSDIIIFPNPATDKIFIEIPSEINDDNIEVVLWNNSGQKITKLFSNTDDVIEMSVQNLTNGIYFVSLSISKQTIITKKIIIAN